MIRHKQYWSKKEPIKGLQIINVITLSRAREEMYTCSAVSTAGASVGGPWKDRIPYMEFSLLKSKNEWKHTDEYE